MRIQHNIMALNSYRQLSGNNSALSKNLEKLSSGYRINRAGDDAAGLAISEKMRAQIKGLEAAQKNANDGISVVQTAEGALTEVHSMLNRMVYLATQSANGIYTDKATDRNALQDEVDSLLEEIDRIANNTDFNGRKLLDGSLGGAGGTGGTGGTGGSQGTPGAAPQVTAPTSATPTNVTDGNGSGQMATFDIDFAGAAITAPTDGSAGAKAKITVAGQDIEIDVTADMTAADIANALNGKTITLRDDADTSDVTFTASVSGTTVTFATTDDVAITVPTADAAITGVAGTIAPANVPATAADAAPEAPTITGTATVSNQTDGAAGGTSASFDVDLTGVSITAPTDGSTGAKAKLTIGGQDIEIDVTADMTGDEIADAIVAKGGFKLNDDSGNEVTFTAVNNSGVLTFTADDNTNAISNMSTQVSSATVTGAAGTAGGGGNGGGGGGTTTTGTGLVLQVGDTQGQTITVSVNSMTAASLGVNTVDISTQAGAQAAITAIKTAIDTVSTQRGALGAVQNRLEHTINNLGVTTENITAAESRIRDTDMAEEMMAYTKNNILVQAAQAMLAQANTVPQGILQLLQ